MPDEVVAKELAHDASGPTIARLAAQRTKFRDAVAKLTERNRVLEASNVKLTKDVVDAVANGGAARIAELEATIRTNAHRGKFDALAAAAGVKPKALADLWEKSGYKADGDPDEAKMTAAIEKQKVERDYLFGDAPAGDETETPEPTGFVEGPPEPKVVKPGPGRGQGGTQRSTGDQFQATDAQLRSPEWCFANQNKIGAAAKAVADLPRAAADAKFTIV